MPPGAETSSLKPAYRPDVDGLRAIAVLLVVMFHMAAATMPGGFIGVDVFFVISGYLISGLILEALEQDRFSFAAFYGRRIRRIAPALFAMIAVTLAAGTVLLVPGDLQDAAYSGLFALVGASNYYFLDNTGYFDFAAAMLPLLHTWSLGVEEQFYLAWPLVLVVLHRITRGDRAKMAAAVILVIASSFLLCLWVVGNAPKHAFYQPFTRAWQLGLGTLMVFVPSIGPGRLSRIAAELLPLSGLALILAAALSVNPDGPYPGLNALLPTVGAALVLYHAEGRSAAAQLLATPPLLFLGKISYSLYLWHWPILVLWRHATFGEPVGYPEAIALSALSLLVATLSWRYIETPARLNSLPASTVYKRAAVFGTAVATAATALVVFDGIPQRLPEDLRGLGNRKQMWAWDCPQKLELPVPAFDFYGPLDHHCGLGADWSTAANRAILWGDSNAQHFAPLLHHLGRERDLAFLLVSPCPAIVTSANAPNIATWPTFGRQCETQRAAAIDYLAKNADIRLIVLSARWSNLTTMLRDRSSGEPSSASTGDRLVAEGMSDLLGRVLSTNRHILIVTDIPGIPHRDPVNCVLARARSLPRIGSCVADLERLARAQMTANQRQSHELLASMAARSPDTTMLHPGDGLCDQERCRTVVEGEFIYRDGIHLRRNLPSSTLRALDRSIGFGTFLDSIGIKARVD